MPAPVLLANAFQDALGKMLGSALTISKKRKVSRELNAELRAMCPDMTGPEDRYMQRFKFGKLDDIEMALPARCRTKKEPEPVAISVSGILSGLNKAAQAVDAIRVLKGKRPKYSGPTAIVSGVLSPNSGERAAAGQETDAMIQGRANVAKRSGKRIGGAAPKRRKATKSKAKRKPADWADYLADTDEMESYSSWKKGQRKTRKTKKAKKAKGTRKFSPAQLAAQRAFAARNRGRKGKAK